MMFADDDDDDDDDDEEIIGRVVIPRGAKA
jgi:hypothetical protein